MPRLRAARVLNLLGGIVSSRIELGWQRFNEVRIAFESDRNGGCLYVMDADGSNVSRLTTGCSKGFPKAWAPDGMLIGWAGGRRSDFDQPLDIQIIRPDGSGRTRLTDSNNVFDLAWGPSL